MLGVGGARTLPGNDRRPIASLSDHLGNRVADRRVAGRLEPRRELLTVDLDVYVITCALVQQVEESLTRLPRQCAAINVCNGDRRNHVDAAGVACAQPSDRGRIIEERSGPLNVFLLQSSGLHRVLNPPFTQQSVHTLSALFGARTRNDGQRCAHGLNDMSPQMPVSQAAQSSTQLDGGEVRPGPRPVPSSGLRSPHGATDALLRRLASVEEASPHLYGSPSALVDGTGHLEQVGHLARQPPHALMTTLLLIGCGHK